MKLNSIEEIRENIDIIDSQIVALIFQRSQYVKEAAKFKKDQDAVRAPDRVQTVINKVKHQAVEIGLPKVIIEKIYTTMIHTFIDYELEQKIQ